MIRRSRSPKATDGQTAELRATDVKTSGSERPEEHEREREEDLGGLLTDPHCRYLLKYLRENTNPVSVTEVARYVVAEITDTSVEDAPDDVHRRVQTWFHHGQLPALDEHGIVVFDPESGTVTLAADPEDGR